VHTDKAGYKSVAYQNIVPVLVEALKTLKAQQDADMGALRAENAQLRARNAAIEAKLALLAQAIQELKTQTNTVTRP
jgi:hypothetical protein